jgi:hypothetical protein
MQRDVPLGGDSNKVTSESSTAESRDNRVGWSNNIVRDIHPDDVFMGRGVARNEHAGNVRYRDIVARHKEEYLATTRRVKKNKIASKVTKAVESNGGRFLREWSPSSRADQNLFVVEERPIVLEKVKQALRFLGRENKDQLSQPLNRKVVPPAILSPSLEKKYEGKPPSSADREVTLQPEELPSLAILQASEIAVPAPTRPVNQEVLPLLSGRSRVNEIHVLEQLQCHQRAISNSTPIAAPASYPLTGTPGIDRSLHGSHELPSSTNPEMSISALLDSIRVGSNHSNQSSLPIPAPRPSPQQCVGIHPILLAMMLQGGARPTPLSIPNRSTPSNFHLSLLEGSAGHTLAPTIPQRQVTNSSILPTNGVWDSIWTNPPSPAGNALQAALPSMNDDQIRMILAYLNSRRNSE